MEAAEILRAAKEKIADPARRCAGELALAANGSVVGPADPAACKWCAEGAVMSVPAAVVDSQYAYEYLSLAAHALFSASPWEVNDGHVFSDVEAMFDKAIEFAEAD